MPDAFYNEIDLNCAHWLRDHIAEGRIADGKVDTRSIHDVRPDDVADVAQAHLFAGLGGWSYALRLAGIPDDFPIWTISCPCQPFSLAGKGAGFDDPRHLWPEAFRIIRECRPPRIMGEQVEGPAGRAWIDLVLADLEGIGYAAGALIAPSASVGAPNIRHRLWWGAIRVADADGTDGRGNGRGIRREEETRDRPRSADGRGPNGPGDGGDAGRLADPARRGSPSGASEQGGGHGPGQPDGSGAAGGVANTEGRGRREHGLFSKAAGGGQDTGQPPQRDEASGAARNGWLGDAGDTRLPHPESSDLRGKIGHNQRRAAEQPSGPLAPWRELEWIACLDGKSRPAQPGIFPLAPRLPGDVARLRAAGNAINPVLAAEVIQAFLEATGDLT